MLTYAAKQGLYKICEILIENGANIEYKTLYKNNALQLAIFKEHYNIAKLLIETARKRNILYRYIREKGYQKRTP